MRPLGGRLAIDGDVDLLAEHLDLLDGRGALQVGRNQEGPAVALAQAESQLAGRRGLAATLQPAQHDDRGPVLGEADVVIDRPHQGDQFVVDDADDLLAGVEGAENLLAERLLGDALDKVVGDREIDVGVEQGSCGLPGGRRGCWPRSGVPGHASF